MNMDRNTVSRSHASAILGGRRRERYARASVQSDPTPARAHEPRRRGTRTSLRSRWARHGRRSARAVRVPLARGMQSSPPVSWGCPLRTISGRLWQADARARLPAIARIRCYTRRLLSRCRGLLQACKFRVSGEFLASWGARFGLLEPKLVSKAAVYGTEGQRFESSRARCKSRMDAGIFADLTFDLDDRRSSR
jgi:hypothetical protein